MNYPKNKNKHISIRFEPEIHDKLFYIAAYEGRSGSGQILYLIRRCIADFEKEHGPIVLEPEKPDAPEKFRY